MTSTEPQSSPQAQSQDTSTVPTAPPPLSETDTLLRSYKTSFLLLLTTYHTHFRSLGYIKDSTLDLLARTVSTRTVQLTVRDSRARVAIGSDVRLWDELVDVFRNAIGSLDGRCYTAIDAAADVDADGPGPYDGPNSDLIVVNSATLIADLRRLDALLAIARNVLTAGEKVQNLAAQTGFDREVCALINLAVKVTARGYDGEGQQAEEDQFLEVSNGFKKLLITSLQFLSNLVTMNERLKLMLWVELFDSDVDHGALAELPAAPAEEEQSKKTAVEDGEKKPNDSDKRATSENKGAKDSKVEPTLDRTRILKKPSRPLTPYLLFLGANRPKIKNELKAKYPEPTNKQIIQEGTRRWNDMPDKDREVWRKYFEESLEKYEEDLKAWRAAGGEDPVIQETKDQDEEDLKLLETQKLDIPASGSDEELATKKSRPAATNKPFQASFDILSNPPPRSLDSHFRMTETANDGIKKLEEGKIQLLKRLDNHESATPLKLDLAGAEAPAASPASPPIDAQGEPGTEDKEAEDDFEDEDEEEDDDYGDSVEGDEEESSEEEDDDDDYAIPGEDGRGLLTDVPLILGPNEIEVLPMIIMSGIVVDLHDEEPPSDTLMNMYTIRCHLLLAQENGRNLLRELLIFVAAWDLREEELYFKFMVKIIEAILLNGLMPFAYGAFKESKDIISPAQAVIMKLLTKIFHSRNAYTSTSLKDNPIALLSTERLPPQDGAQSQVASRPLRPDVQTVHFLFSEFRTTIIPQICALIFLQGQIRVGHAQLDDFPLNLWDMERMYEGVYQYLEFFAILTDHDVWKERMAEWEVVSELVTLLRELEAAIPKKALGSSAGLASGQANRGKEFYDLLSEAAPDPSSATSPVPVAVERPYDVTPSPQSAAESAAARAKTTLEAEALKMANQLQSISDMNAAAGANRSNNGSMAPPPTPPPPAPAALHDEPADFEWRNLKKLCVLVLSSLVWKNKTLQDQVRNFGGINVLLSCCSGAGGIDEHNPYIREHAIMCLRFLIEGNEECANVVRGLAQRGHAQKRARENAAAKSTQQSAAEASADADGGSIPGSKVGTETTADAAHRGEGAEDAVNADAVVENSDLDENIIPVPAEVLDHHGYETFMDAKGQVGLRRKDPHSPPGQDTPDGAGQDDGYFGAETSETPEQREPPLPIPPPRTPAQLPEWMQMVMKSLPKADAVGGGSSSGSGAKR